MIKSLMLYLIIFKEKQPNIYTHKIITPSSLISINIFFISVNLVDCVLILSFWLCHLKVGRECLLIVILLML